MGVVRRRGTSVVRCGTSSAAAGQSPGPRGCSWPPSPCRSAPGAACWPLWRFLPVDLQRRSRHCCSCWGRGWRNGSRDSLLSRLWRTLPAQRPCRNCWRMSMPQTMQQMPAGGRLVYWPNICRRTACAWACVDRGPRNHFGRAIQVARRSDSLTEATRLIQAVLQESSARAAGTIRPCDAAGPRILSWKMRRAASDVLPARRGTVGCSAMTGARPQCEDQDG